MFASLRNFTSIFFILQTCLYESKICASQCWRNIREIIFLLNRDWNLSFWRYSFFASCFAYKTNRQIFGNLFLWNTELCNRVFMNLRPFWLYFLEVFWFIKFALFNFDLLKTNLWWTFLKDDFFRRKQSFNLSRWGSFPWNYLCSWTLHFKLFCKI